MGLPPRSPQDHIAALSAPRRRPASTSWFGFAGTDTRATADGLAQQRDRLVDEAAALEPPHALTSITRAPMRARLPAAARRRAEADRVGQGPRGPVWSAETYGPAIFVVLDDCAFRDYRSASAVMGLCWWVRKSASLDNFVEPARRSS